jgi:hypothetical protein
MEPDFYAEGEDGTRVKFVHRSSVHSAERSGEGVQAPLPSLSPLGRLAADAYNASTPGQTGWNEAAEAVRLVSQHLLVETLIEVRDYLRGREDVNDGNDGRQVPNEAMSILTDLGPLMDYAIQKATS